MWHQAESGPTTEFPISSIPIWILLLRCPLHTSSTLIILSRARVRIPKTSIPSLWSLHLADENRRVRACFYWAMSKQTKTQRCRRKSRTLKHFQEMAKDVTMASVVTGQWSEIQFKNSSKSFSALETLVLLGRCKCPLVHVAERIWAYFLATA